MFGGAALALASLGATLASGPVKAVFWPNAGEKWKFAWRRGQLNMHFARPVYPPATDIAGYDPI
jgi:hypothetical protein